MAEGSKLFLSLLVFVFMALKCLPEGRLPSKPTVTLQPSWTQIYSGETVTVRCEIQGGEGAQWTYEWRAAKLNTPPTSNEYRIIRATESDSGGYSCRGRRDYFFSEWSDIITLTVQDWENCPVHPVTEGASVSLSCSLRTQKILSNVFFYHNDKLIENDPRGELKISAVSKSDEGFYKCQYSGRESAQSWMSVKGEASFLFLLLFILH
uniref:Ig-like domain-containing protein n=1 Tax=Astatotilapia calliptera TaxID=8154 RepID=A0A3P8PZ82_ASTCA